MYGSFPMRHPMIGISNQREQNPTAHLTSSAIHDLTNIKSISFMKLTLEVGIFNVFPLKTGTDSIYTDSVFSYPQCQLFLPLHHLSRRCA